MRDVGLQDFLDKVIAFQPENIQAVVLLGGIFRNKKIINQWSDIDLIIIWKDILSVDLVEFSDIIDDWERSYMIRLDITQVSVKELMDINLSQYLFNGIIINALKRDDVRDVIYGSIPDFKISDEQEKQSALFYINHMLFWQREYYIESLLRSNNEQIKSLIPILIRRTFSIVRASLRLFDIYCHPYEDSIYNIENKFPEICTNVLWKMLDIKDSFDEFQFNDIDILLEIRNFTEIFVDTILKKYNDTLS